MIAGVLIRDLQKFKDKRGWLTEIYRDDEIDFRPLMSYVSMTEPGVVRGPHEHKEQSDCFVFVGPGTFEVHLWDRRENSSTNKKFEKIIAGENEPKLIIVPPGVVHGYKCVSEKPGFSINLPDKLYKGENKTDEIDEIRHEEDKNSPYVIK
jgi:dTDP-4-dehydrorhamnose 3,5-epimerase